MTARKLWNGARRSNKLPKEWRTWAEFRAWVNANRYKASYGYKGEFTPDSLLKAIPGYEIIGIDLASGPDKTGFAGDFNSLMRLKLEDLKQLATDKGIDIGEAATKREIAMQICGGDQIGQNR